MTRLSYKQAKTLGLCKGAKSKFNNNKVTYYDASAQMTLTFDSQKEYEYYLLLRDRQKRGEITELQRQVKITIQPRFKTPTGETIREIYYLADFVYIDLSDGLEHIVDVKGFKTDVYKLKKKLLAYKGFYIEEV